MQGVRRASTRWRARVLSTFKYRSCPLAFAPGLSTENDGMPDVMRGEETQVFGALEISKRTDGLFLLPGTHSKWVRVIGGRIGSFRTFMTGEVFGALKEHTILGRLMRDGANLIRMHLHEEFTKVLH